MASHKSGLPLSAFRLITEKNNELFDHVRLSQYDIGEKIFNQSKHTYFFFYSNRSSSNINNSNMGWMVGFLYLCYQRFLNQNKFVFISFVFIQGYTKAVIKLLSSDELVRQYMLQVALFISAHYGNVDLVMIFCFLIMRNLSINIS